MPANRQGIDALCGVYATINGLELLCPDIHPPALFEKIVRRLDERKILVNALVKGTRMQTVILCMQEALRFTRMEHGVDVGYARPFQKANNFGNILSFKKYLDGVLLPSKCVALVGLAGRMEHWSILRKTQHGLGFYDSSGLSRSDIDDLSLGKQTGKLNVLVEETVILTTDFSMNFSDNESTFCGARHASRR